MSSPCQKTRPVSYEIPPSNSSHQVARQDLKYGSPSEMSNYQHRSVPANSANPMDRTRHKNGQQPSTQDDLLYSQLPQGERSRGGQRKLYKDALRANLTMLDVSPAHLESLTGDRTSSRALCRQSIGIFEDSRVSHAENSRRLRKTGHASTSTSTVHCDVCGRTCGSRICLFSLRRTHL